MKLKHKILREAESITDKLRPSQMKIKYRERTGKLLINLQFLLVILKEVTAARERLENNDTLDQRIRKLLKNLRKKKIKRK